MVKNNRKDNQGKSNKHRKSSNSFKGKGQIQDRAFSKGTRKEFGRKDSAGFNRGSDRNFVRRDSDSFRKEAGKGFEKKGSSDFKRETVLGGARGAKRGFDSKFASKFDKKITQKPINSRAASASKFTSANNYKKKTDTINNTNTRPQLSSRTILDEDSGMVYGRNAVIELLKSGKTVDKLFVQSGQREGSVTMIVAEAIKLSIPIIEADKRKLDSMLNHASHQGVVALTSEKEYCSIDDILDIAEERGQAPFILVADKIMDAHNLGAIIRSAECAGIHGIIIPKRNAVGVSPVVVKASAGAAVHMAVAKVANITTAINELKEKGVWIFSAVAGDEAENCTAYSEADYTVPTALVVGNEGEGLSPIIVKNSDFLVMIPMFGKIESLNVSCASAILLYEAAKQRRMK